ncbi:hypothetical protein B0H12DRAFT_1108695 [Mycena haematopus]|nr:hypothetical protein B0H12DRAFT_1108695 [Mycena haematopus]
MPSLVALTIYLFGATSFLVGVHGLLNLPSLLEQLSVPTGCLPLTAGTSLAAIAMGIYYTLAAYQENRMFFIATVPMRGLTAVVFCGYGHAWRAAAVWEGSGSALTAAALGIGYVRRTPKTKAG